MGDHDELQGHDPVAEEALEGSGKPKAHVAKSAPAEKKKAAKKVAKKVAPKVEPEATPMSGFSSIVNKPFGESH